MIRKIKRRLYLLCFIPFVILIRLLSPVLLVRIGAVFASRIGHLGLDIEITLCTNETRSAVKKYPKNLDLFYVPAQVSNKYLLKLWENILHFLPKNFLEPIHLLNQRLPKAAKFDFFNDLKKAGHFDLSTLDQRPPHLSFPKKDLEKGKQLLEELGVLDGESYVCLAVRDGFYLKETYSDNDWDYHNYRDSKIENYLKMAEYLVSKGLKVLRMGSAARDPLESRLSGVIDYANSPLRSDFADVFLFANCKFCISTSTGMDALATIFRTPTGLVNIVNRESVGLGSIVKLYQPKEMIDLNNGSILTFQKKVERNLFDIYDSHEFKRQRVLLVENDSDELQRFASELYELMESKVSNLDAKGSRVPQGNFGEFSLEKLSKTWLQNHPGYLA